MLHKEITIVSGAAGKQAYHHACFQVKTAKKAVSVQKQRVSTAICTLTAIESGLVTYFLTVSII